MACFKLVLLTTLYLMALCSSFETVEVDRYKKAWSYEFKITFKDGKDIPTLSLNADLTVYGDYNKTRDQELVSNMVTNKIALLEPYPVDGEVYSNDMPLVYNLTIIEHITVGPSPIKNMVVDFNAQVYAKKKEPTEALSVLKSFKGF